MCVPEQEWGGFTHAADKHWLCSRCSTFFSSPSLSSTLALQVMVLDNDRGVRAPKWLWLAVRETLLIGWQAKAFRRVKVGAKEAPDAEAMYEYATTTWLAEPYGVDLTVYEGAPEYLCLWPSHAF